MTRAVAYLRVSTDQQAEAARNSLPLQEKAVRARALDRGYELVDVFTEVMSGRKVDRPEYQRMLEQVRAGGVDVILVTWLDRFGRNDREITARVLDLQETGVTVEPTEEQIPDFITLVLSAWKAGQEVQRITDRTSDAIIAAARRGVTLGKAPYGYVARWDYLPNGRKTNHRFEISDSEAQWVRFIFEQYVRENRSLRWLAHHLNTYAPKAGGRNWTGEEVRLILRRQRYVGDWTYFAQANSRRDAVEVVVPGALPAIIDRDLFEAAAGRLEVKAGLPPGRTQTSAYLLGGLARCGHCGGPMHGSRGRRQLLTAVVDRPSRYYCDRHRRQSGCEMPNSHLGDLIEAAVLAFLEDIAGNVAAIREAIGERATGATVELLEVKRRLAEVDARFDRNMRMFDAGTIASEDQLATWNRRLAEDKQVLERDRDRLLQTITAVADRQREVAALPDELPGLLDPTAPLAERKAVLQRYVARVELREGNPAPYIVPRFME